MGSFFTGIGDIFGVLFSPIHTVFQYLFFQPVFNVLMLIYQGVHSFGFSIILLTLLIRGSLFPLTRKQLASSRKMQALAPRIKQLQAQYRGDTQGFVAAQQALYKENNVSMYGGCLPLLIQMPFLYALYYSFYQVLNAKGAVLKAINDLIYPFLPHLTAAPNPSFLGLSLIAPNIGLAIVAGALTFVQMRMALPNTPTVAGAAPDTTTQTAKTMQYIMPFFTIFIGSKFPAGLALYWTISTLFSAVQQYFITGWGSLWVGVPGMERFVPKPNETLATLPPPSAGGRRMSGVVESAAPAQQAPSGGLFGRLRDSMRQIQEQAAAQAAADREAAEARRAGAGQVVEGSVVEEETDEQAGRERPDGLAQKKQTSGARDRRSRGSKSGVTLVRAPSEQGAGEEAPETRITQENSGDQPAAEELPEKRIAREVALASSPTNGARTAGANASGRSGAKGGPSKASGQNGQGKTRGGHQSGPRNRSGRSR